MKHLKRLLFVLLFTQLIFANSVITNPFLWEVRKDNQHFYLFGTMHLADPALQTLPLGLKKAIDVSDAVFTEISMDMQSQLAGIPLMMRNDGKSLKDILPTKLYGKVEQYLKNINPMLNIAPFDGMKVWALSAIVSMLPSQLKYPMMQPIDAIIYNYAETSQKEVGGVESITEQLGLMDRFSLNEQILGLESSLDFLATHTDVMGKLKDLYIAGDSVRLMVYIKSMMFQIKKYKAIEEKFMQTLLYNRNKNMTHRLLTLVNKNPKKKFLFAFGVMHFLEDKSIVSLLKSKGYEVKRVN